MRALVLGATGLLGKALMEEWPGCEVRGAASGDADIRNLHQVRDLLAGYRPQWTILAAAYTDVDGCELDPKKAHEINCVGAENVARAAAEVSSRLLFLSTDYVFDSSKGLPYEVDDAVCPINAYGRSKAEAEGRIRQVMPDGCILRTAWLYGSRGKCFPNTILKMAEHKQELTVVTDQCGSPTFNRDLARAIIQLTEGSARGTVHATNSGQCSWFEFAQAILEGAGRQDVMVRPISSQQLQRAAARPHYSVLSCSSLQPYGVVMRPWREALGAYLEEVSLGGNRQSNILLSRG